MREFVGWALFRLGNTPRNKYGSMWVMLKMEWFRNFAKGRITSTKHGTDFFSVINTAFEIGEYVYDRSEYDKNFALTLQEHGVKIRPA